MNAPTDINALLRAKLPEGMDLQIPPPCLLDMQGEFVDYVEGRSLSARFPVLPRYGNPLGHMQGGFIVAALDNTLGPFSYLVAPPSATVSLNTQYLRPVTVDIPHIVCTAWLVERTRAQLHLRAQAADPQGRVLALCQATAQVLEPR